MHEELDPYIIRDVEIVNSACTRWLQKRGLQYSFRELIRKSCRNTYAKHMAARREQRQDDKFWEEEFGPAEIDL
jgi:hypothetical protein